MDVRIPKGLLDAVARRRNLELPGLPHCHVCGERGPTTCEPCKDDYARDDKAAYFDHREDEENEAFDM